MTCGLTNRIRVLRAEHGESQAELAERLGISRFHLCDVESARNNLTKDQAAIMAHYYGLPQKKIRRAWELQRRDWIERLRRKSRKRRAA